MNWIRLNITCKNDIYPVNFSEDIANLLIISGADTFTTDDFSDLEEELSQGGVFYDYIDEELLNLTASVPVIHAFFSEDEDGENTYNNVIVALKEFKKQNGEYEDLTWDRDIVRDEDWENNWKEFFKPFPVGNKLFVKPSWEEIDEETKKNRLIIEIDPSSSFGTGTHATTKLCLERLEKVILPDARVLDMGCGSGILSIGALLLGAKCAMAVDIDEVAAKIARENLNSNGFDENRAVVLCGNVLEDLSLSEKLGGEYDVICANIVSGIIIEMSQMFIEKLKPHGTLIASGIIEERECEVKDALEKAGFSVKESSVEDGWCVIIAEKA